MFQYTEKYHMKYGTTNPNKRKPFCKVCYDAHKPREEYSSHFVRETPHPDSAVVCPTLLSLSCNYCKTKGHTISHCPILKNRNHTSSCVPAVSWNEFQDDSTQTSDITCDDSISSYTNSLKKLLKIPITSTSSSCADSLSTCAIATDVYIPTYNDLDDDCKPPPSKRVRFQTAWGDMSDSD